MATPGAPWLASFAVVVLLLAGAAHGQDQEEPASEALPVYAPSIPLVFCAIATLFGSAIVASKRASRAQAEHFQEAGVKSSGLVTGKRVEVRSSGDHSRRHYFVNLDFDAKLPSGEPTGVSGEFELEGSEHGSAKEMVTRIGVLYNAEDPRRAAIATSVEEYFKPGAAGKVFQCCIFCFLTVFFLIGIASCIGILLSVDSANIGLAAGIAAGVAVGLIGSCAGAGLMCGRRARFGSLGKLVPPSRGAAAVASAHLSPA